MPLGWLGHGLVGGVPPGVLKRKPASHLPGGGRAAQEVVPDRISRFEIKIEHDTEPTPSMTEAELEQSGTLRGFLPSGVGVGSRAGLGHGPSLRVKGCVFMRGPFPPKKSLGDRLGSWGFGCTLKCCLHFPRGDYLSIQVLELAP